MVINLAIQYHQICFCLVVLYNSNKLQSLCQYAHTVSYSSLSRDTYTVSYPCSSIIIVMCKAKKAAFNFYFRFSSRFSSGSLLAHKTYILKYLPFSTVSFPSCLIFPSDWLGCVGVVASFDDNAVSVEDRLLSL